MKLSRYVIASEALPSASGANKTVVFSTRSGECRALNSEAWSAVEKGELHALPNDLVLELTELEFLVPDSEDELAVVVGRSRAAMSDDRVLYFSIQPTAWCQLDCGYCGQSHKRVKLSERRQEQLLAEVGKKLERSNYDTLEISWFGGEPLHGLPEIRALTPRLASLAAQHRCAFQAKLITNGLALSRPIAREIVESGTIKRVEVTIDGPPEHHDTRRPTKSGKPTFDVIYENLKYLAGLPASDLVISVRCNVDRRNAEGVPKSPQAPCM